MLECLRRHFPPPTFALLIHASRGTLFGPRSDTARSVVGAAARWLRMLLRLPAGPRQLQQTSDSCRRGAWFPSYQMCMLSASETPVPGDDAAWVAFAGSAPITAIRATLSKYAIHIGSQQQNSKPRVPRIPGSGRAVFASPFPGTVRTPCGCSRRREVEPLSPCSRAGLRRTSSMRF